MGPLEKIKNAWLQPGINPREHYAQQDHLRRYWPTLYKAITEATKTDAGGEGRAYNIQAITRQITDNVHRYFPGASVSFGGEAVAKTWGDANQVVAVAISLPEGNFALQAPLGRLERAVEAECEKRKHRPQHHIPHNPNRVPE